MQKILGTKTIEGLLDRLQDSRSMSERNRILQAITQIGEPAVGPVVDRLHQDEPWYFIRNLVLLLGRIGNGQHLEILDKWLVHSDYRVQREVIKSVQSVGGKRASPILLYHLDTIDERLKGYLVSVLGAQQYREAIPCLIEMLSSRSIAADQTNRDEIREKICEALGRMQAEEAIPALENIVRTRRLFNRKEPENVRSAAVKALAYIKRSDY